MLYLKNTLGGLSRSLTDSALSSFQGPHRWWKLALFAVLFVLPGGSVGVAVLAWVEHRRGQKGTKAVPVESVGSVNAAGRVATAPAAPNPVWPCPARSGAACPAAACKHAPAPPSSASPA